VARLDPFSRISFFRFVSFVFSWFKPSLLSDGYAPASAGSRTATAGA
jgi:hypothetical protein